MGSLVVRDWLTNSKKGREISRPFFVASFNQITFYGNLRNGQRFLASGESR